MNKCTNVIELRLLLAMANYTGAYKMCQSKMCHSVPRKSHSVIFTVAPHPSSVTLNDSHYARLTILTVLNVFIY